MTNLQQVLVASATTTVIPAPDGFLTLQNGFYTISTNIFILHVDKTDGTCITKANRWFAELSPKIRARHERLPEVSPDEKPVKAKCLGGFLYINAFLHYQRFPARFFLNAPGHFPKQLSVRRRGISRNLHAQPCPLGKADVVVGFQMNLL